MGMCERSLFRSSAWLWPTFWFVTAGVLAAMSLGRTLELDELVTELGRSRARLAGWYRTRRGLQAALVGSVAAVWTVVVLATIWRVPERRRRYLPTAIVVFTMVCFVAIRLVSLHHADALLYNHSIAGVSVVAAVEWTLLALVVASTYWRPFVTRVSIIGP
jgi:xanthine/uracil permease